MFFTNKRQSPILESDLFYVNLSAINSNILFE